MTITKLTLVDLQYPVDPAKVGSLHSNFNYLCRQDIRSKIAVVLRWEYDYHEVNCS